MISDDYKIDIIYVIKNSSLLFFYDSLPHVALSDQHNHSGVTVLTFCWASMAFTMLIYICIDLSPNYVMNGPLTD